MHRSSRRRSRGTASPESSGAIVSSIGSVCPMAGVYVVGVEWPDDVESLAQMYVDNYVKHHTCSQAKNQREVTVGGEPAVLFTVDSCGSANENLTFARLAVVHDGVGLIAFTETGSGEEAADMDRLFERFSGLEWRTG